MFPPMGGARAANDLPPSHPVRVFMDEHVQILGFLDELEKAAQGAQKSAAGFEPGGPARANLMTLAAKLLGAEPHHQREEQALFPRMEDAGVEGPPHVMRMEHDILRKAKHALEDLAKSGQAADAAFVERLGEIADTIVGTLRAHIHKEDNILYPMALQAVPPGEWAGIIADCERIGPCEWSKG